MGKRTQMFNVPMNYFETIDSETKAYLVGLYLADGWISKNVLGIELAEKDLYILEQIRDLFFIKGTKNINRRAPRKVTHQAQYTLLTTGVDFLQHVKQHGIVERKSLISKFPTTIPEKYIKDFIRGVFDGDGTISIEKNKNQPKFGFTGTLELVSEIRKYLLVVLNTAGALFNDKRHSGKSYNLNYCGNNVAELFYNYLYYDNVEFFMKRKKELFEHTILNRDKNCSHRKNNIWKIKNVLTQEEFMITDLKTWCKVNNLKYPSLQSRAYKLHLPPYKNTWLCEHL